MEAFEGFFVCFSKDVNGFAWVVCVCVCVCVFVERKKVPGNRDNRTEGFEESPTHYSVI